MAQAEVNLPEDRPWPEIPVGQDDLDLGLDERNAFRSALSQVFSTVDAARLLLVNIGFPVQFVQAWTNADQWWTVVFGQFANGVMDQPLRRLLMETNRLYPTNRVFRALATRYAQPNVAAQANSSVCHIIVRASNEDERAAAERMLRDLGFAPTNVWATEHAASYAVSSSDAASVRARLARTDLGWTVVPPGQPDYLLRELYVQGPDGSRFRMVDAPAQQTVGNVAGQVAQHYQGVDSQEGTRPTVVDRVNPETGARERVDARETLHEANVQEGDHLRVGFESTAGAVNPRDRQNALDRVLKQVKDFAASRPGMVVSANSATLPTEYEIEFDQPSFGPPPAEGMEPTQIDHHRILLELGEDFPETAPHFFWLTPIFHPNVFPTYESEQRRDHPHSQGLVCLGMLADGWYPAMDFGEVLQTVVDVAGYRNYDLFQPTIGPDGSPVVRPNFYDRTAAEWAHGHQAEIMAIGGNPIVPRPPVEAGYPNVVIALDC